MKMTIRPAVPVAVSRRVLLLVAALLVAVGLAAAGSAAAQDALPLKRVLLSTGGVAYFEHEATVDGDVELPLTVRLAQVDDVLKSIVVYDDRGGVGTISLPGREPLVQAFRDLPFDGSALASPVALLRALVGSEIRVTGARTLQGRILGVTPEEVALPNGLGRTTRHRVSVVVPDEGVRQFLLEDSDQVEFVDPKLRADVAGALAAISQYRVQDRRTLHISLRGGGRRVVRVGYVVEAPLWKTSYRLTVPDIVTTGLAGDGAKGLLQGWAVVENMSGQDWKGVEVTLASGNPVTFRQALYTAYYAARPEVPVEVMGRVLPPIDTGVVQEGAPRERAVGATAPGSPAAKALRSAPPPGVAGAARPEDAPAVPAPPVVPTPSEEATTQVLFRVPGPVDVVSGHSLVIPIVNRDVPIRRVALYDGPVSSAHPLAAVRLQNDAGTGLPPGVLTLYERSAAGASDYVGDARLAALPAGESRLLGFALDQKVQVSREARTREAVASGKISKGVFQLVTLDQQTTVYRIKAPAQEARVLLIEHPRLPDWRLVSPAERDVELTRDRYRIRATLKPGEEATVEVTLERPRTSSLELTSLPTSSFLGFARTGALGEKVRKTFETLAALRGDVEREERALVEVEAGRKAIVDEQERLRANLGSVPGGDLRQRYLDKLRQQEDQLDKLQREIDATRGRLKVARTRLADTIAALDLSS